MVNSDNYKKSHTGSLIVPVNFEKYQRFTPVIKAYNVLEKKERRKSAFLMRAIRYYDELPFRCEMVTEHSNRLRVAKRLREYYRIETGEDLERLLTLPPDSMQLRGIRALSEKEPRKMLLGFSLKDDEAVAMHKRLCSLCVNDRIMLIVRSTNIYTADGMDEEDESTNMFRLLKDIYVDYQSSDDKRMTLETVGHMMGL